VAGDVGELGGELGRGELECSRGLLEVALGVGNAVGVGEFIGDEGGSGEAVRVVVGVGVGQPAGEHFARVCAHVEDEREQLVAGGEPFEVVCEEEPGGGRARDGPPAVGDRLESHSRWSGHRGLVHPRPVSLWRPRRICRSTVRSVAPVRSAISA
jgi:hypothetical protein